MRSRQKHRDLHRPWQTPDAASSLIRATHFDVFEGMVDIRNQCHWQSGFVRLTAAE